MADNAAWVTTGRQLAGKNMKQWGRQKQHQQQHQPAQTGFDWQCLFQIKFMLINHWIIFAATIRRQFFTWKLWIAAGTELTKLNYVVCVTPQEDLNTKYICWEYFKVFIHKIRKRCHWSRIKSIFLVLLNNIFENPSCLLNYHHYRIKYFKEYNHFINGNWNKCWNLTLGIK